MYVKTKEILNLLGENVREGDTITFLSGGPTYKILICKDEIYFMDEYGGVDDTNDVLKKLIVSKDVFIVNPSKKIGDLTCSHFVECSKCPIRLLCCGVHIEEVVEGENLFSKFKRMQESDVKNFSDWYDEEVYDLINERLRKDINKYEKI